MIRTSDKCVFLSSLWMLIALPHFLFANSEESSRCLIIAGERGIDRDVISNMAWRVRRDFRVPVRILNGESKTNSLLDEAVEIQRQFPRECVCFVALVQRPATAVSTDRLVITGGVAVLNINSLRVGVDNSVTNTLFLGRVSKAVMSSIGRILGLPPCRLPFCAMYPSRTESEFDQKAENFCPLCLHAAIDVLQAKGVEFLPRERPARGSHKPAPTTL